MSNDLNSGANKLIERILDDAHRDAKETEKQANEACDGVYAQAERESAASKQAFIKQRDEAVKTVIERSRTNAELFARKQALDKRREVLDRVFNDAYDALCAYDDNKRGAVITDMLLKEAEGGESVRPAKADRELIKSLLPSVNDEIMRSNRAALTLSDEDADDIFHGFELAGDGFLKDCSFLSLIRDVRISEETNVSSILFN